VTADTQDILFRSFEDHCLDPAGFKHREHVIVAYLMLRKYDFPEAVSRYTGNVRAIATRAGAASKFNMTITIAFISLIAERMQTASHHSVKDFLTRNHDLLRSDLLKKWYSDERLQSELARHSFLMPDIGGTAHA